jgi:hypothetical protein
LRSDVSFGPHTQPLCAMRAGKRTPLATVPLPTHRLRRHPLLMRLCFFAAAFITCVARADQLYMTVSVDCTPSRLTVSMQSAWNADGERLLKKRRPGSSWNTSRLVQFALDDQGRYRIADRPRNVKCTLGKRSYSVLVQPSLAPGFHPEGWCATRVGANVTLRAGSQILFTGGTDACTEEGNVPTVVELTANGTLNITRVPARVFLEPR